MKRNKEEDNKRLAEAFDQISEEGRILILSNLQILLAREQMEKEKRDQYSVAIIDGGTEEGK